MMDRATTPTSTPSSARKPVARAQRRENSQACLALPVTRNPYSGTQASSTSK